MPLAFRHLHNKIAPGVAAGGIMRHALCHTAQGKGTCMYVRCSKNSGAETLDSGGNIAHVYDYCQRLEFLNKMSTLGVVLEIRI
jgi:hypothetical protein